MTLTPKQFNLIATKDDLNTGLNALEKKIDNKIDKVLNAIDGLAKNVQDFQTELASNQGAHDRMQKYIESLEKRVIRIEIKTGLKTKKQTKF
jgi:predicted  nucleic acid-binding Zn-ribbon protein